MAANPSFLAQVSSVAEVNEKVTSLSQRVASLQGMVSGELVTPATLVDEELSVANIAGLLITEVNGSFDLPEQRVTVTYLTQAQRLVIPQALGMPLVPGGPQRISANTTLVDRYWRAANHTYLELKTIIEGTTTIAEKRDAILSKEALVPGTRQRFEDWDQASFYTIGNGVMETSAQAAAVFASISHVLQFNCDIRDCGLLALPGMSVTDTDWTQTFGVDQQFPLARLRVRGKPYTVKSIAALNLPNVGNMFIAAMARAYGVVCGVMPVNESRTVKEYTWTIGRPTAAAMTTVTNEERSAVYDVYPVAMNILAMFGIFHLNKDHTYRTGDANMERIGTSYVNTLRTMLTTAELERFQTNKLHVVRTAAHPFGLAQTYWLYRYMYRSETLAPALAIRHDSVPPTLARLSVVIAAKNEWANLPVGLNVNSLFGEVIVRVENAYKSIGNNAPAYSSLHRLYGVDNQVNLTDDVRSAIANLMPCVYGFAMSQHVDEKNNKDGLALAQCLDNVARDAKTAVEMWKEMWDEYVKSATNRSLPDFIKENIRSAVETDRVIASGGAAGA